MTIVASDTSKILATYSRHRVDFVRAEGAYLYDQSGERWLDFLSGVGVNALGHCHPHLVDILCEQARKVWHVSNLYTIHGQQRLAERLTAHSFADSVFYCNSGAEAVEAAIKVARRYHYVNGAVERYRLICFDNAFHGRTLATIAAGGQEKCLEGFGPPVEGFDHVAFGNTNEIRAAITPETAGILLEPVQGEGGLQVASGRFMQEVRALADAFGLLLILDEVQSGIGRTGKFYAHEWADIQPDILATAKGLGNGFPIGACLLNARTAAVMGTGSHGSTFGGNPLAMAIANGVLDVVLEDGFLERVQAVAAYLHGALEQCVADNAHVFCTTRGLGLMCGLRCHEDGMNVRIKDAAFGQGLLCTVAGDNMVRLLPPLIITPEQVDEAIALINESVRAL